MRRGPSRSRPSGKLATAILMVAIAALGFAMLMVRLEVTQEGYRLSALRSQISKLRNENRTLKLKTAELSSHERLRALAPRFHLGPPTPGQVVMLP